MLTLLKAAPKGVAFFLLLAAISAVNAQSPKGPAVERWLAKPVLESRLLDGMEDARTWTLQGQGELALTSERSRDGAHSLRLRAHTIGE